MKKPFLLFLMLVLSTIKLSAHLFEVDGIYYNMLSASEQTVAVTFKGTAYSTETNEYEGVVKIPEMVAFSDIDFHVVSIEDNAFRGCTSLQNVVVPMSVTIIGNNAFSGCISLQDITLPQNNITIGSGAFSGCTSLTKPIYTSSAFVYMPVSYSGSYIIPNGIKTIAGKAFQSCTKLTEVTIPSSVTNIGTDAFSGCSSLKLLTWNAIAVQDKYSKTSPFATSAVEKLVFGDGVLLIPEGLARSTSVKEIVFSESVQEIGAYAFTNCTNLKTVVLPNSLTTVGGYVFNGCTGITQPIYNATHFVYMPVSYSGAYTIPQGIKVIDIGAFAGCTSLVNVTINDDVEIIKWEAFSGCTSLMRLTIGKSVKQMYSTTFERCSNLIKVQWNAKKMQIFEKGKEDNLSGCRAFRDSKSINEIIFGDEVSYIPGYACSSIALQTLIIPESIDSIGRYAFANCTNLKEIYWNAILCKDFMPRDTIYEEDYSIPSLAETMFIGGGNIYGAFHQCSNLERITFGDKVLRVPAGLFLSVANESAGLKKLKDVRFSNSIQSIGKAAFKECEGLDSICIPNNVRAIEDDAFSKCSGLVYISLPDSLKYLRRNVLSECINLKTCVIPQGVVGIDNYALAFNTSLRTVNIPESVTYVTDGAFIRCDYLNKVIWNAPDAKLIVTTASGMMGGIYGYAYFYEGTPRVIEFGEKVKSISSAVLASATRLDSIVCKAIAPPELLGKCPDTIAVLSVPCSSRQTYRQDEKWGRFTQIQCLLDENTKQIKVATSPSTGIVKGGGFYLVGDTATITATDSWPWKFVSWQDGNQDNPRQVKVTDDATYTALFEQKGVKCRVVEHLLGEDETMVLGENTWKAWSGDSIQISATNKLDERGDRIDSLGFYAWRDGETNQTRWVRVDKDTTIVAEFRQDIFTQKNIRYVISSGPLFSPARKTANVSPDEIGLPCVAVDYAVGETVIIPSTVEFEGITYMVTAIDKNNYYNKTRCFNNKLVAVTLPETLLRIGAYAFEGCEELKQIDIPNSVTEIDNRAFKNCFSLSSINISPNESRLKYMPYLAHTAITSITIPIGIERLYAETFTECRNLKEVKWYAKDCRIEKMSASSTSAFEKITLHNVIFGDSVQHIPSWLCTNQSKIKSIIIPNSVQYIEEHAFAGTGICSITIPSSVTFVGDGILASCKSLKDIYWFASDFGSKADLWGCDSIRKVVIDIHSEKNINMLPINWCSEKKQLESLSISIVSPDETIKMQQVFTKCINLKSVHWNIKEPDWYTFDCLKGDTAVTKFTFGDNVKVIPCGLCVNMKIDSIYIPKNVQHIEANAFNECQNLKYVYWNAEGNEFKEREGTSSNAIFEDCPIKTLIFGDNVNYIPGLITFSSLDTLSIPKSVKEIGWRKGTKKYYAPVSLVGKIFYDAEDCTLLYNDSPFGLDNSGTITFGPNVKNIPAYLCHKCRMTEVTIPDNIKRIGDYAFRGCEKMTNIHLPNSVQYIGNHAFAECKSLDNVILPQSIDTLQDYTFYNNTQLKNIVLPDGLKVIKEGTFTFCAAFNEITLPNGLTRIDSIAFKGCSNLKHINIPNSLQYLGSSSFEQCSSLEEVSLPDKLDSIHEYTFYQNSNLKHVNLPKSLKSIQEGAFNYCSSLESITIPDSVVSLENGAFNNTGLKSITCMAIVPPICNGTSCFYYNYRSPLYVPAESVKAYQSANEWKRFTDIREIGCFANGECGNRLKWFLNTDSILTIKGTGTMWDYCNSWEMYRDNIKSIVIEEGVTSIGSNAFFGCTNLQSVAIPASLVNLGADAFYNCTSLSNISVDANNKSLCLIDGVLYNKDVTSLIIYPAGKQDSHFTVPSTVTTIMDEAFSSCQWLVAVTIPSSVVHIGIWAFVNCSNLASITCESQEPPVCDYACFDGVDKSIPLYVPCSSVSAYKVAEGWKEFTNIMCIQGSATNLTKRFVDRENACKYIYNGQLLIDLNGKIFNAAGVLVK